MTNDVVHVSPFNPVYIIEDSHVDSSQLLTPTSITTTSTTITMAEPSKTNGQINSVLGSAKELVGS